MAKITAEQIWRALNNRAEMLPEGEVGYSLFGHELHNIVAIQCQLNYDTLGYTLGWKTKEGRVDYYVLPDVLEEEDLTALLVAMRMT